MSTRILPNLEVQVVIDDNDNCYVSSGSSGFVSFMQDPVGMKLPIKCWIHTHPFWSCLILAELIGILSIFGKRI